MAEPIAGSHDVPTLEHRDHHIVELVRSGDVAAFELLVDRYHGDLTRHLVYRVGDADLGADLAQDAFLESFRNLHRFTGTGTFRAWLYGIANRQVQMHWRRQRIRRLVSLDVIGERATLLPVPLRAPDPTAACAEDDLLALVLARLTPPLREVLLLHSLDGLTTPEIAGVLKISRTATERRLSRAKAQFRDHYDAMNTMEGRRRGDA